jgi:hypothetical protein
VFGDLNLSACGASRKQSSDLFGEFLNVISIKLRFSFSLPLSATFSGINIGEAFAFCLVQRVFFNQKTLPLVSFADPAEFKNYRGEHRMFSGASRERGISGRQEHQLVQVGARQAEGAFVLLERNPRLPPQLLTTLVTLRVAVRDERFDPIRRLRF